MSAAMPGSLPGGYLLDTNVISADAEPRHKHHGLAASFLNGGPPSQGIPVFMSPVNLTEIRFGVLLAEMRDGIHRPKLRGLLAAVQAHPQCGIDRHTANLHAEMRVRLAVRFMPAKVKAGGKLGEIETWKDEFTNGKLGVEDGDMWLAAQAIQFDLTLVTLEAGFVRHREIAHPGLAVHLLA